jgi:ABC-type multidrug transport system ATPase subunit
MVDEICATPDATTLPGTQQRVIMLARAFLLSPSLYLLDLPEQELPDKQVAALISRLTKETKMGRTILLISDNRQIQEACDHILVLQGGRVVDYGEGTETRRRLNSGWRRFVGRRQLEIEESLHSWIRSHFKRDGDDGNRAHLVVEQDGELLMSVRTTGSRPCPRLSRVARNPTCPSAWGTPSFGPGAAQDRCRR